MAERINISSPEIDVEASIRNLQEVLLSGQLAQGSYVKTAEDQLARLMGAEYVATTNNGTSSLKAAICAGVCAVREIEPAYIDRELAEGEVVVPAFSFNATLNAALQLGAKVKVVDILPDTFCLDSEQAKDSAGSDTLAVIAVDLYGQPADTRNLEADLSEERIALIRDSAQAHGGKIDNKQLVEHADAVSFSFYATKNINSGEGGAVATDDPVIDDIIRMYRNQGMKRRYHYEMIGDNLRMSELHAAVLVTQIGRMAIYAEARRQNAARLTEQLAEVEGITIPHIAEGMEHVFHQYTVLVEPSFGIDRDELVKRLDSRDIGSGIYYPMVMTDHKTYKGHPRIEITETPVAREVAKKALSLPVHTKLSLGDIERITNSIKEIQSEIKGSRA